jgi:adenine-specific DNA-methyltransferase
VSIYYQDDRVTLYHGDCREVMRTQRAALVVTSPPYDAGKEYEDALGLAAYTDFARRWTAEIPRLLTDDGSFWLNVGFTKTGPNTTLPLTYLYANEVALPLVQEVVWHYEGGMAYKRRFAHRTERWQWFAPNPTRATFNLDTVRDKRLNRTDDPRNHPLGKNPTDYWYFDRVTNNSPEKSAHPCQFPEDMVRRIVLACSNPGDVVFDPFAGSGTTLRVAKTLGRNAIGVEIDERYCETIAKRLAQDVLDFGEVTA